MDHIQVFTLSGGEFSSIDWMDALLDYAGPCRAVIATWTAASADMERVHDWLGTARLTSAEWIVDRSFPNRQPEICAAFREKFGDDSIRVFASHAKFSLLSNDDGWKIVALTSANLNQNKRVEFFHAADDPDLFDQFEAMVRDVFAAQAPGEGFETDAGKARPNKSLKKLALVDRAAREGVGVLSMLPLK
jgi:hypothetical protein